MLSRPTTEQILLDCCRELMTNVLPSLTDATAQVSVIMVETVLRNTAVRAAHEVAWMRAETAEIDGYAHEVVAQAADAEPLRAALAALADAPRESLHLDDVVETYCRAGNALSVALETAVAGKLASLVLRGEEILDIRSCHETEVMAGWSPTGR